MYYRQEQIQDQLFRLFQSSEIWKFFKFLRSSQAKEVIKFNPNQDPDNPKTFYFNITQLRKKSYQLASCSFSLVNYLQKQGMTVRFTTIQQPKPTKYNVLSHDFLSLKSTKAQIMQVWKQASIATFLKHQSVITKTYIGLQNDPEHVKWNKTGTALLISPKWQHFSAGYLQQMRQRRFYISNFPEVSHTYLHQSSTIDAWFVIYLKNIQQLRSERFVKRERRLERNKMLMMPSVKQQSQPLPQKKPQEKKPQKVYNEKLFYDSLKKQYKIVNKNQPIPKNKLNEYQNCLKMTILCKVSEMKSFVAIFQAQNIEMQLGSVMSLLDDIRQNSHVQIAPVVQQQPEPEEPEEPNAVISQLREQLRKMKERVGSLESENTKLKNQRQTHNSMAYL